VNGSVKQLFGCSILLSLQVVNFFIFGDQEPHKREVDTCFVNEFLHNVHVCHFFVFPVFYVGLNL